MTTGRINQVTIVFLSRTMPFDGQYVKEKQCGKKKSSRHTRMGYGLVLSLSKNSVSEIQSPLC